MKYWYHFAIMFEALFILTTIDAGTRIARFLIQEFLGKMYKPFEKPNWLPGTFLSSALVVAAWGWLIWNASIRTIWPMFGIANQMLAVIALCVGTIMLINAGRARYVWVTLVPMTFVSLTTLTAAVEMVSHRFWMAHPAPVVLVLNTFLVVFIVACTGIILLGALMKWCEAARVQKPLLRVG